MVQKDIPNLDPTIERGFQLDTGELVVVAIFRPAASPQGIVAITILARIVNPDGSTMIVGGQEARLPGHTIAFTLGNLGDDAMVMPSIAAAMEEQAQKARGVLAALKSLASFATVPAPSATTGE